MEATYKLSYVVVQDSVLIVTQPPFYCAVYPASPCRSRIFAHSLCVTATTTFCDQTYSAPLRRPAAKLCQVMPIRVVGASHTINTSQKHIMSRVLRSRKSQPKHKTSHDVLQECEKIHHHHTLDRRPRRRKANGRPSPSPSADLCACRRILYNVVYMLARLAKRAGIIFSDHVAVFIEL